MVGDKYSGDKYSTKLPDPSTAQKVARLSQPDAYPGAPALIETIETHWSWLFLTPWDVYKMKKPVPMEQLDFSKLEVRRHNCYEEVRLNRRLASNVYIGAEPLIQDATGRLSLQGSGRIVEWLVHMRRLPAERMLDEMIKHHRVDWPAFGIALEKLWCFYLASAPVALDPGVYLERFARGIARTKTCLLDPRFALDSRQASATITALERFFKRHTDGLSRRVSERYIIEAHGDLRPEHICLTDPPAIIDCLEFDPLLRLLDPVDELAYFSIECEAAAAPQLQALVFDRYRQRVGDLPPPGVRAFYLAYRASLRARQAILHLLDDPQQLRRNWRAQATQYLGLTRKYIRAES